MSRSDLLRTRLQESIEIRRRLLEDERLAEVFDAIVSAAVDSLVRGGKILLCGNGGSSADAQHLAAELVGRFQMDRRPLPAISLTDNVAALTAISNDQSYDQALARAVRAFGCDRDLLIGLSTSGESRNVIEAIEAASELGMVTVALVGAPGSSVAAIADHVVTVPSPRTAAVQEVHKLVGHTIFELVESEICAG